MKKVTFGKLKTSLSRNFVLQFTKISGILSSAFLRFCCKFRMKIIFYPPVNTNKLTFVALLVFVCTTASFIAKNFVFRKCLQTRRHLGSSRKTVQWIAKDTLSYGGQSKRAKIASHWFGKYYNTKYGEVYIWHLCNCSITFLHLQQKTLPVSRTRM